MKRPDRDFGQFVAWDASVGAWEVPGIKGKPLVTDALVEKYGVLTVDGLKALVMGLQTTPELGDVIRLEDDYGR